MKVKQQPAWKYPKLGVLVHVASAFRYDILQGGIPRSGQGPFLAIGEEIGQGYMEARLWQAGNGKKWVQDPFLPSPGLIPEGEWGS